MTIRHSQQPVLQSAQFAHSSSLMKKHPAQDRSGAASCWWLHHSIQSLALEMGDLNIPLVLRRGPAAKVLDDVLKETGAGAVFWNRRYDPGGMACDTAVKAGLTAKGITARSFDANLLHKPWQVMTGQGSPYRKYTPFWRTLRAGVSQDETPHAASLATPVRRRCCRIRQAHRLAVAATPSRIGQAVCTLPGRPENLPPGNLWSGFWMPVCAVMGNAAMCQAPMAHLS